MTPIVSRFLPPIIGGSILLLLWQVASLSAPTLIPSVSAVARATFALLGSEQVRRDVLATVSRTLLAVGIAIGAGVPLGAIMGSTHLFRAAFGWLIDFLRSIPAFVLLPLFITVFRSGDAARLGMAAFGAGIVMLASTAFGAAHGKPLRVEVARVYGASRLFRFAVAVRGILPAVADGVRISVSLGLVLVVVGEIVLGATYGLGTRVNDSLSGFELDRMYALTVIVGCVGYALNLLARVLTNRWSAYGRHL
ncbi:MAG TPA: ABC transporter permease subunit [Tepidisphaeraceae bacterium]|nr:ABC transporter permease subunit [Tepidisphaeraceae bacterium]